MPGPQFPLYVLGRKMESIFPMVPLARRQALCVGIMSYNGQVNFGLIGDYDAMADLDSFALDLEAATAEIDRHRAAPRKRARRAKAGSANGTGASPPSRAPSRRLLADQPAADLERDLVGQVAPVEPAGAEAVGAGVGVDDDGGDAAEAAGVAEAHRSACRRRG